MGQLGRTDMGPVGKDGHGVDWEGRSWGSLGCTDMGPVRKDCHGANRDVLTWGRFERTVMV